MIGTFLQGTIKLIIASSDYKDFDAPLIITLYDYDRHFREWIGLLGEVMELWDSIVNIFFILFQMLQLTKQKHVQRNLNKYHVH